MRPLRPRWDTPSPSRARADAEPDIVGRGHWVGRGRHPPSQSLQLELPGCLHVVARDDIAGASGCIRDAYPFADEHGEVRKCP